MKINLVTDETGPGIYTNDGDDFETFLRYFESRWKILWKQNHKCRNRKNPCNHKPSTMELRYEDVEVNCNGTPKDLVRLLDDIVEYAEEEHRFVLCYEGVQIGWAKLNPGSSYYYDFWCDSGLTIEAAK